MSGRSPFRNVLVPLDAGSIPRRALRTAAEAAAGGDVEITLLHVIDAGSDSPGRSTYTVLPDDDIRLFGSHIRRGIGDALAIASEYDAAASALVVVGGPLHAVINQVARALRADVIIMGTHGRRRLSRVFSGNLIESVIKEAEIPVQVVYEPLKQLQPAKR